MGGKITYLDSATGGLVAAGRTAGAQTSLLIKRPIRAPVAVLITT